MQFFILSPLIFLPMWHLSKRNKDLLAVGWWSIFMLTFTSVLIGLTLVHNLPPEHGFL